MLQNSLVANQHTRFFKKIQGMVNFCKVLLLALMNSLSKLVPSGDFGQYHIRR